MLSLHPRSLYIRLQLDMAGVFITMSVCLRCLWRLAIKLVMSLLPETPLLLVNDAKITYSTCTEVDISIYIKLEAVRYTEMSVCPISRGRLFATMRCPCVQFPVEGVRLFATLRCPDVQFPVERGHTNISLYERLPGDIRTSHCANGSQGTYGHLTVQTAPRGHMDISQ